MKHINMAHSGGRHCPIFGAVRAGMHQKTAHEFMRGRMSASEEPEAEDVEEICEGTVEIAPDPEIEAAVDEAGNDGTEDSAGQEEDELIPRTETLSRKDPEKIPVIAPQTGGRDCAPREVIYDRGDGSPKEIALPEIIQEVLEPVEPELQSPSANVAALPEEPEGSPDPGTSEEAEDPGEAAEQPDPENC